MIDRHRPDSWEAVRTIATCEDGAVAVIAAFAIPVVLGFAGLGLEYGQLLVVRAEAQRTADLASHAAAAEFARTGDTEAMADAARGIARLNGFGDGEIAVAFDSSIMVAGGQAVRATVKAPRPLVLPRLLGSDATVDVVASAAAGTLAGEPACIQAIDPDRSGITLSGSASIETDRCGVASNAAVEAPCGTAIVTESLSHDSASGPVTAGCGTITAPGGGAATVVRRATPDPLAGTDGIMAIADRMADTALLGPPEDVVVPPGPDIEFGWNQSNTMAQAEAIGCTASFASGPDVWTFSCPGKSVVDIGALTIGGGLDLNFNPGASPDVVYNFSGSIRNTGDRMTFAGGSYAIAQGLITGGGSTTEFGAGTYRIGRASQSCDGAQYSLCNTATLRFDGASTFVLPSGVRNSGGAALTLGTETGNSFRVGPSSGGSALSIGGGAQIYMGEAVGGVFELYGRIDGGGGGSCLVLPAAEVHEINGSIVASGAIRFGAGLYVVDGYVHIGSNGGGSSDCQGETISVEAIDTTFAISGNGPEPSGWECRDRAFCVSAGYSNIHITAPVDGPHAGLAVVGPLSPSRTAGALFTSGASGAKVSGAFYFPNGPVAMSGGAGAGAGDGGCLQVIGTEITLSGGTSAASDCDLPQTSAVGQVVLLR